MPIAHVLSLLIAQLVIGLSSVEVCDEPTIEISKAAENVSRSMLRYNAQRRDWMWTSELDGSTVPAASLASATYTAETLRNRSFLFVGDSTVRNTVISVIAATCNSLWLDCAQAIDWGNDVTSRVTKSVLTCGSDHPQQNSCATDLSITVVPIVNLTSERLPRSKRERKWMWKSGVLPPLVRVRLLRLNCTIDVVEAGCAGGGDGLWLVFRHFLRTSQFVENLTAAYHLFGRTASNESDLPPLLGMRLRSSAGALLAAASRPVFLRYDLVFTSAGLHCTYKHYRAGMWYRDLKRQWRRVTVFTPVVWMEISHCLKDNTGHFFTYGGRQRLNYKKLASCPFIDTHVGTINQLFANVTGIFVSPTRFITKGLRKMSNTSRPPTWEERGNSSCLYADYLHPGLRCYAALSMSHMSVMRKALEWKDRMRRLGCIADIGGHHFSDSSLVVAGDGVHVTTAAWESLRPSTFIETALADAGWLGLIAAGICLLPGLRLLRRQRSRT